MYTQSNTVINNTVENILVKAYTIANTASKALASSDMTALYTLYEADTTYAQVLEKFSNEANALLAAKGNLRATVSQLVTNITGTVKTDAQIDALIALYTQNGIDSWGKLFTFWINDTNDEVALSLVSAAVSEASVLFPATTAPVFSSKISFDENTAIGTQIYDADVDDGDSTVAYALLSSSGIDHLPFTINAATGVVSMNALLNYEAPIDFGANNSYNFTIRAINASGSADQNIRLTVKDVAETVLPPIDPSKPFFSSTGAASIAENSAITTVAYNATADGDSGIKYSFKSSLTPTDSGLFNIDAKTGDITFKTSPDFESPLDIGHDNTYNFTVRAINASGKYADQAVTLKVTDVAGDSVGGGTTPPAVTTPPKGAVIDLGTYGKLIAPVQVNGNWYYAWDMNGDGVHNTSISATGKYAANGAVQNAAGTHTYVEDRASHDILDALFTKDVNGAALGTGNTSDVIRFGTISGVSVALPTAGVPTGTIYIANNGSYTDVAEVWDTYNVANTANGAPTDWYANNYLTATPSSKGHEMIAVNGGYTLDAIDPYYGFVMLQVI